MEFLKGLSTALLKVLGIVLLGTAGIVVLLIENLFKNKQEESELLHPSETDYHLRYHNTGEDPYDCYDIWGNERD